MPSFRKTYSDIEIGLIVAYVMSLSPDSGQSSGAGEEDIPPPANVPLSKQAEAGEALFFNGDKEPVCATCHSYRDAGGPIGRDLVALAAKPVQEIYRRITHPAADNLAYPAVSVTFTDGRTITGIQRDDKRDTLRIYDLSSAPPVLRSYAKSDVAKVEPVKDRALYQHDLGRYSKDELPALIAFLKSAAANPPADVKAADLGSP
jgi:putative heme-binding domain-containing protein